MMFKTRRRTAAALLAAAIVATAPTVCAEESPQPEVSIIDITEEPILEPAGVPAHQNLDRGRRWIPPAEKDLCGGRRRFSISPYGRQYYPPGDLLSVSGDVQRGTARFHRNQDGIPERNHCYQQQGSKYHCCPSRTDNFL